jgi:two-component system copper resistance phosphate regulon response regulator CusR
MTKVSSRCHSIVILVIVRAGRQMRVLVVEDEPRILSFVARGLDAEGYVVDAAPDGAVALKRLEECVYDLVVLDLLLPHVDGLTVLRESTRLGDVPVIVLSARSDLRTKLRGFELGACDYVVKPFALDELLARVRAQLRRHGTQPGEGSLLRAGRLELDVARRQARIGELVADLSEREFRLLHHLVVHVGEVLSRERLLAEVWGYHFDPGSNVVDVCVRRLRKKLGAGAPIATVRHAGYRLDAA